MKMSKELAASLAKSAQARKAKRSLEVTKTQRICRVIGKRIIRKVDGRKAKPQFNSQIPAEQIGIGGLRPTWHGRAS